ncbi:MAG: glycine cleavage system protein GcvH [Clostridia bacterium]|nr:glycine cleavage system protein GcvH [Clostridia bacterium]
MNIPQNLRYTKSHEWVQDLGDGKARVGLTDHAQSEMGDIVFVTLPEVGDDVAVGERLADVESVKAVSEVYSPLCGKISAVNDALADDPAAINNDAYGAWLAEIDDIDDMEGAVELLSADEYAELTKEA